MLIARLRLDHRPVRASSPTTEATQSGSLQGGLSARADPERLLSRPLPGRAPVSAIRDAMGDRRRCDLFGRRIDNRWVWKRLSPVVAWAVVALALAACGGPAKQSTSTSQVGNSSMGQPRLTAISFVTASKGYGLFEQRSPSATTCTTSVAKTTDGGSHFSSLTSVVTGPCATTSAPSLFVFDDSGDGFVYDAGLYVSHDGGAKWRADPQSGTVLSISTGPGSIWMDKADCQLSQTPPSCPMGLFVSRDGGRSWAPPPSQPVGASTSRGVSNWMVRTGADSGFILGVLPERTSGSPTPAPFWHTTDGGASWTPGTIEGCGGDSPGGVFLSAAPDGTLFAVCGGVPSAGQQPKSVARSTDGGRTWQVHTSCAGATGGCSTQLSMGYVGGIDAVSSTTAYLVGLRSWLMVTHDGGATWSVVQPTVGSPTVGTSQVIFFNSTNGVVLDGLDFGSSTPPELWHTTDGGTSWSKEVPQVG